MPGHGRAAVVDLGQAAVVGSTEQGDVLRGVVAAQGKGAPVVELEPGTSGAASALPVHVAASAPVPLVDGPDPADADGVPASVRTFFDREVKPHVPDAWIDTDKRDAKDGRVGLIGYEINFNRYFYKYVPPRPLEEIEADIKKLEGEIMEMLRGITN